MRPVAIVVTVLTAMLIARSAGAAGAGSAKEPPRPAGGTPSAEERYNAGNAAVAAKDWTKAETLYRLAVQAKPGFAEAWNGLGHSLKMQRRFADAVLAYRRALDLRPEFPQALEYLGEAYVEMGKSDEAKAILVKLEPLDATLAKQLSQAIAQGKSARW